MTLVENEKLRLLKIKDLGEASVELPHTSSHLCSGSRDIAAAKRFYAKAILERGPPERITIDCYPATHTALNEVESKRSVISRGEGQNKQVLK